MNEAPAAEPLFILCPGRSFSSVVCSMLGQHPQMYGFPELNLFVEDSVEKLLEHYAKKRKRHMLHGLARVLAQIHEGIQSQKSVDRAWLFLEKHRSWTTGTLYRYLANRLSPKRCVDKSPTYPASPERLERLLGTFPKAFFLHLTRHPWHAGASLYRVYGAKAAFGRWPLPSDIDRKVEEHWVQHHENILDFARRLAPGRYVQLQGEMLLGDPERYLAQIANWLGISDDPEAIEAMKHPERSPYACFGPPNARYGNNLGFLEKPELRVASPSMMSLDEPLPWSQSGKGFSERTVVLARRFGYR